MLILAALMQPMRNWLPPSVFTIAYLVAGVGILYSRSWAYYVTYVIAFSRFLVPALCSGPVSYVPFAYQIAWKLRFIDVPMRLTINWLNILFIGTLAWTHWMLRKSDRMTQPIPQSKLRRFWRTCLALSGLAAVIPVLSFFITLFVDPPSSSPRGFGGGFLAIILLHIGGPISLVGLVGFFMSRWILKRMDVENSVDA